MKVINLTPHTVNVIVNRAERGVIERNYPPSGVVARVSQEFEEIGLVDYAPLCLASYGETVDLPAEATDTFLIVSALVRLANPNRRDLISPSQFLRDEKGQIIGCQAFEGN